ncbi:hypothetical protein [Deinococcus sp.]|uniref:hypothetical protein n=1 Tax=Deinococcus sp. TaxID=47478 RepID=UPI003C7AAE3B
MPQTFLGEAQGEWFTATTQRQGQLLSDAVALQHLEPFMGRTLGPAEAAREVGVSVERMIYRVRQFLEAGLLSGSAGPGRVRRLYSAPAGFQLPLHLTPFPTLEGQLSMLTRHLDALRTRAMARELTHYGQAGMLLYRDAGGKVTLEIELPDRATHDAMKTHSRSDAFMDILHLGDAQAARAQALLEELRSLRVGASEPADGRHPYLIQVALVRLLPEDVQELKPAPGQ